MAEAVSPGLLTAKPGFYPSPGQEQFTGDEVALGIFRPAEKFRGN